MKVIFSFLLSLLCLTLLNAQDRGERSPIQLEDLVVSTHRWQVKTKATPRYIRLIKQKEIEELPSGTMADLMALTGEVFVQKSQQGGGSPMIRGFSTNRLLYVVDGVRMNTAIFRAGNLHNIIALDPYALEQAEVLFGANSVIYGSDAIGGVMNFQTLKPSFAKHSQLLFKGKASTRYASANNEMVGHLDFNLAGKKWSSLTSVSYHNFGNLCQGKQGLYAGFLRPSYADREKGKDIQKENPSPLVQTPSGYSQLNLMQKIAFRPSEFWSMDYAFHYSDISSYARYDRLTEAKKGKLKFAEWNYGPQKWVMHNLSILHKKENFIYDSFRTQFAYQSFEESRIERKFGKKERDTTLEKLDAYSLNLDFYKTLHPKVKLFYGAEYVRDELVSTGTRLNIENNKAKAYHARYPNGYWQSIALYLQSSIKLHRSLIMDLGLRYNDYRLNADYSKDNFDLSFALPKEIINKEGDLSYTLGFTYSPQALQDFLLKLNVSKGFRTPNIDDMGKLFKARTKALTVPNPDLKSEYVHNFDFGLSKTFAKKYHFDLLAYYSILNNAIVSQPFALADGRKEVQYKGEKAKIWAMQNVAKAEVYGLQFVMDLGLFKGLNLRGQVNYQKGVEKTNGKTSPLRHSAPLFGKFALGYAYKGFSTKLYTYFQGQYNYEDLAKSEQEKPFYAKDENGKNYAPAWATLNWQANYRLGQHWLFSLGLENILDKGYRPYSSGISAAGRSLTLSTSYRF